MWPNARYQLKHFCIFNNLYTYLYAHWLHILWNREPTHFDHQNMVLLAASNQHYASCSIYIFMTFWLAHTQREIERNSNGTECTKYSILKAYCHPYGCYEWQHIRRTINLLQHLHNYSLLLLAVFVTRISTRMLSFEIPYGWKFWQYWDKSNDRN